METLIKNIDFDKLNEFAKKEKSIFADENLFISMYMSKIGSELLELSQPYFLGDGRIILVSNGSAEVIINLEKLTLKKGTCLITPAQSIFEMEKSSKDFIIKTMSYKELPNNPKSSKLNVLQLNLEDENLVNSYFQLIWQESQRKNLNIEVILIVLYII